MARLLTLLVLAQLLTGCALLPGSPRRPLAIEDVAGALDSAESELAAGQPVEALERLERVNRTRTVTPEDRQRADGMIRSALDAAISNEAVDSRDLTDVYELDLPRSARALAGVAAAERLYEDDRPVAAFKMARKVEFALPAHPERARAGDLVTRAGFDMLERGGKYYLFLSYRQRGIEALEFLVVHYPFHPACEEAYLRLARTYEASGDHDDAIEHLEDLLVYHPNSSIRQEVEARLPALRLAMLEGRDYDRGELELAHSELLSWLDRNSGHPLEGDVIDTLELAQLRLARSDLKLARYYARIDVPYGVRFHALRALEQAQIAAGEDEMNEAIALLARFPEGAVGDEAGTVPLDDDALELVDPLGPRLRPAVIQ